MWTFWAPQQYRLPPCSIIQATFYNTGYLLSAFPPKLTGKGGGGGKGGKGGSQKYIHIKELNAFK